MYFVETLQFTERILEVGDEVNGREVSAYLSAFDLYMPARDNLIIGKQVINFLIDFVHPQACSFSIVIAVLGCQTGVRRFFIEKPGNFDINIRTQRSAYHIFFLQK